MALCYWLRTISKLPNRFSGAIEVNGKIAVKHPDDVQIRLDLAKCHINLGEFLRVSGDINEAITSLRTARTISEPLAKQFPDKPRYHSVLAKGLFDLALALEVVDPTKVEGTYDAALAIFERLVKDYPANQEYPVDEAHCLQNLGLVVAEAGRPADAEAMYKKALILLDPKTAGPETPALIRDRAEILSNLGQLRATRRRGRIQTLDRPFNKSGRSSRPAIPDIHNLAIAQNNLAQLLVDQKRLPEAGALFAQSVSGFEKLDRESPKTIDFQKHFAYVLARADFLGAPVSFPKQRPRS